MELADEVVVLVVCLDVHRDDAALAVAGLALFDDRRARAYRVAVEHGIGVLDVVVREVSDDGPIGGVGNRQPYGQRERVEPVDEALAELGLGGELAVEMQRLLVHRHVTEILIVAFAYRPSFVVCDGLALLEFLVVAPGHGRTLARRDQKPSVAVRK